jgi:SAM-dependent methyltransferase
MESRCADAPTLRRMTFDVWARGDAYEQYVGRWSRQVAALFVDWLALPAGAHVVDVGCGTGAVTGTVLARARPERVLGVDASPGFLGTARSQVADARAAFQAGDARALPIRSGWADAVVSGLALNFVPEPGRAAAEFLRVSRPGARVAAYVWDYAEGMRMMRYFWDAAVARDPAAGALDEGPRFPLCRPDALRDLWTATGLDSVEVRPLTVPTVFADFDDLWRPFLGGQGAAPGYLATLTEGGQAEVRELLRERVPVDPDGSIRLTATAWAVRGAVPS